MMCAFHVKIRQCERGFWQGTPDNSNKTTAHKKRPPFRCRGCRAGGGGIFVKAVFFVADNKVKTSLLAIIKSSNKNDAPVPSII
jgi:hypothetical protein